MHAHQRMRRSRLGAVIARGVGLSKSAQASGHGKSGRCQPIQSASGSVSRLWSSSCCRHPAGRVERGSSIAFPTIPLPDHAPIIPVTTPSMPWMASVGVAVLIPLHTPRRSAAWQLSTVYPSKASAPSHKSRTTSPAAAARARLADWPAQACIRSISPLFAPASRIPWVRARCTG